MPKIASAKISIFVPTRGRVTKQISQRSMFLYDLGEMDPGWSVTYVVPECELRFWNRKQNKILVVPDEFKISDIRQFILQQSGVYHVVIDDDLYLSRRKKNDWHTINMLKKERKEAVSDVKHLFTSIERYLANGWIHGGVSAREGNNRIKETVTYNNRVLRFHFYNAPVVRSLGFDYRRTVVKQDFDFTLFLLEKGIPNLIIFEYTHLQSGSNTEGGCSRYRTNSVMTEGAHRLKRLHPGFVKVVDKPATGKQSWGGEGRVDVKVYWKKAYAAGVNYVRDLQKLDPATLDAQDRILLRLQSTMPVLPNRP